MSDYDEQSNFRRFIRRFWWIAPIIIVLLILICGFTQAEQILKLFKPPNNEPTESPTDVVTERVPTEVVTEGPTDTPSATPTDEPTRVVTEPPPQQTQVVELPTEPTSACNCQGADTVCTNADGSVASITYNDPQCGGDGGCACRGTTW